MASSCWSALSRHFVKDGARGKSESSRGRRREGIRRAFCGIESGDAAHIGIVGRSAEGAALCYRTICLEGAKGLGPHAHPEVTLHTFSLATYVQRIERDDWQGVGELMIASGQKLAQAGADFLICPDNTIHQALRYVELRSPRP